MEKVVTIENSDAKIIKGDKSMREEAKAEGVTLTEDRFYNRTNVQTDYQGI